MPSKYLYPLPFTYIGVCKQNPTVCRWCQTAWSRYALHTEMPFEFDRIVFVNASDHLPPFIRSIFKPQAIGSMDRHP